MNKIHKNFCNSLSNIDIQKKLNGFSNPKILSCSTMYDTYGSINNMSNSNEMKSSCNIIDIKNIIINGDCEQDDGYDEYFDKIIGGDESFDDISQFSELTKLLDNNKLQNEYNIDLFDNDMISIVIKIKYFIYIIIPISAILFLIYYFFTVE